MATKIKNKSKSLDYEDRRFLLDFKLDGGEPCRIYLNEANKNCCQPFKEERGTYLLAQVRIYDPNILRSYDGYVQYRDSIMKRKTKGMTNKQIQKWIENNPQYSLNLIREFPTKEYPIRLYIYGEDDSSYAYTFASTGEARDFLRLIDCRASTGKDLGSFLRQSMIFTN